VLKQEWPPSDFEARQVLRVRADFGVFSQW
jgi:hypothetical protein